MNAPPGQNQSLAEGAAQPASEPLPGSVLELQVAGLLERVTRYRDQRRAELRAAATAQTREILKAARAEARANVRSAVALERARNEQGLRQAQAQAELEARQRAQQHISRLLASMWGELPQALAARWQSAAGRRAWIAAAVTAAGALLAGRAWRIAHGEGWAERETRELEALALAHGARSVERVHDASTAAGMRIYTEGACVDATPAGLTARRAEIEAAFLAGYPGAGVPPGQHD